MKILSIGDPHFKKNNSAFTDSLHKNTLSLLKKDKEIEMVVIMGDIMDDHASCTLQCLNRAIEYIKDISLLCDNVKVLIGNHDRPNNLYSTGDEHFFKNINIKNVKFVDDILVEDDILFAPYFPPTKLIPEILDRGIDPSSLKLAFSHQEYKYGEWEDDWCKMFSGHIHDKHELGSVYYVGTPYQINFGESGNKTVCIIDSEDGSFKEKDLGIPKRESFKISFKEFLTEEFNHDNYTRIDIIDTRVNIAKLKKLVKYRKCIDNPLFNLKTLEITPTMMSEKSKVEDDDFTPCKSFNKMDFKERLKESLTSHKNNDVMMKMVERYIK